MSRYDEFGDSQQDIGMDFEDILNNGYGAYIFGSPQTPQAPSSPSMSSKPKYEEDSASDHTTGETWRCGKPAKNLLFDLESAQDLQKSEFETQRAGLHNRNLSSTPTFSSTFMRKKLSKRFSMQPHLESPTRSEFSNKDELLGSTNLRDNQNTVGEEPGIDVEMMHVDLPDSCGSQVTLIDYSPDDCSIAHYDVEKGDDGKITASSERDMLQHHISEALNYRPKWSKVRWVVVNGLSWEAIQPIVTKYELHPLAVEDMLDVPQRTKMDVFPTQLFCCFPLHLLSTTPTPYPLMHSLFRSFLHSIYAMFTFICSYIATAFNFFKKAISRSSKNNPDLEKSPHSGFHQDPRGAVSSRASGFSTQSTVYKYPYKVSKTDFDGDSVTGSSKYTNSKSETKLSDESIAETIEECIPFYTLKHGMLCGDAESSPVASSIMSMPSRSIYEWNQGNIALKKDSLKNMHISGSSNSIEIAIEQVSLFLVGDTVITFFEKSAPKIYRPLEARLKRPGTLLRNSCDPAILVQAVLDASVDLIGPICNEYRYRLNKLQVRSLQQPNSKDMLALHWFSTDLGVLRPHLRSLGSIMDLLWSKSTVTRGSTPPENNKSRKKKLRSYERNFKANGSGTNFISRNTPKSRYNAEPAISDGAALYFRDLADHSLRYLQDVDDMDDQAQALGELIFRVSSIGQSSSVTIISLVSAVFLPLTFLTGYFGMNFKFFPTLENDVGYYWLVATPAAATLLVCVSYPSFLKSVHDVWIWFADHF